MEATYLLAIDLGKRHFQVCGTDVSGKVLFNRPLSRLRLCEWRRAGHLLQAAGGGSAAGR